MRVLLIAALVAAALGDEPFSAFNYHENIGTTEALKIKQAEEAVSFDGMRIVGGSPSPVEDHPYLAGLVITLTTGDMSVCAGSVLSNTRVVTAAHCWWDGFSQARSFTVVLGSARLFTGGVRVASTDVDMHASFNPFSSNNDIAIVTIPWVDYSSAIQPIPIMTGTATQVGLWAAASGYGRTGDAPIGNNQVASQAFLQVIANAACQQYYGTWSILTSSLCTSGTGSAGICGGDSGGPLVVGNPGAWQLIGVASFSSHRGCRRGLPSVYTRVASFATWINARL